MFVDSPEKKIVKGLADALHRYGRVPSPDAGLSVAAKLLMDSRNWLNKINVHTAPADHIARFFMSQNLV